MYIYIYIIYMCVYIYTYIYHIYIWMCIYIYTYIYIYVYIYMYIYQIYIYIHTRKYKYVRIQLTKICIRLFSTKCQRNPWSLTQHASVTNCSAADCPPMCSCSSWHQWQLKPQVATEFLINIDIHINLCLSMWLRVQIYIHFCEYVFWKWSFLFCWQQTLVLLCFTLFKLSWARKLPADECPWSQPWQS